MDRRRFLVPLAGPSCGPDVMPVHDRPYGDVPGTARACMVRGIMVLGLRFVGLTAGAYWWRPARRAALEPPATYQPAVRSS